MTNLRSGSRTQRAAAVLPLLASALVMLTAMPAPALEKSEREALVLLLLGEKDNPVKQCMTGALALNVAYTAFRMGRVPAEEVRRHALEGVTQPAAIEQRERELAIWRDTQAPGRVAEASFESCLRQHDIHLTLGPLGRTCFSIQFVGAMSRVQKDAGFDRERARAEARRLFEAQLPGPYLDDLVDDVYAARTAPDDDHAQRKVFVRCVVSTRD